MEKSVIFDLDGTLWDTTKQIKQVWSNVATRYKLEVQEEQIRKIMGLTKNEIIHSLFADNFELGDKFITECLESEIQYLSKYGGNIYSNTIETLKKLYNDGYNLYIVSNCQIGYIEAFLRYYHLNQYIKDYECSGNTGKDKSHNIRAIMQRNDIVDTIYVGDTEKDYIATKNNNLQFIWANYGFGKCNKPDKTINDISDLLNILS